MTEENIQNNQNIPENDNGTKPFDSAQAFGSETQARGGKLKELELKCEEYLNNWKRSAADFINYKKDEIERMALLGKYAKEDTVLKILPVLDSIYLLDKHTKATGGDKGIIEGIELIEKQIEEFLKKEGIEEIKTVGEKFNAETMEAVAEAESTEKGSAEGGDEGTIAEEVRGGPTSTESGTVVEELQKGYKMNGKVLRPAKVRVTK